MYRLWIQRKITNIGMIKLMYIFSCNIEIRTDYCIDILMNIILFYWRKCYFIKYVHIGMTYFQRIFEKPDDVQNNQAEHKKVPNYINTNPPCMMIGQIPQIFTQTFNNWHLFHEYSVSITWNNLKI